MLYKTMTLELLQARVPHPAREIEGREECSSRPSTAIRFIQSEPRLPERGALRLRPQSHPEQISSEALEIAIEDLRAKLSAEQSHDLTLDGPRSRDETSSPRHLSQE